MRWRSRQVAEVGILGDDGTRRQGRREIPGLGRHIPRFVPGAHEQGTCYNAFTSDQHQRVSGRLRHCNRRHGTAQAALLQLS